MKNPIQKLEQRKTLRYEDRLTAMLKGLPGSPSKGWRSIINNISEKGFRVRTKAALEPGQNFSFELELPENHKASGLAQCRWAQAEEGDEFRTCGASILLLEETGRAQFQKYIYRLIAREPVTYRAASTRAERQQAYRLVYKSYLGMGYMQPHPSQIRFTPYHLARQTITFTAQIQNLIIATITLFGDGEKGLPLEEIYGPEIAVLRREGRQIAEIGALAHRKEDPHAGTEVFFNLCRMCANYALRGKIDDFLIMVNPRHRDVYPKLLRFTPFGPERSYGGAAGHPAIAYRLDLRALEPHKHRWFFGAPSPEIPDAAPPFPEEDQNYFKKLVEGQVQLLPSLTFANLDISLKPDGK